MISTSLQLDLNLLEICIEKLWTLLRDNNCSYTYKVHL